eukprot:TRINITY_DN68112_c6_g2_i1.p1 TRINITY_DN68112_c6_g2~~TRINITY_DN68112_c6_g2_i1.p1  ORF type:complete len:393 (-),score=59.85 TRINITY_DN68112_c6_g2_i1:506-1684(-)
MDDESCQRRHLLVEHNMQKEVWKLQGSDMTKRFTIARQEMQAWGEMCYEFDKTLRLLQLQEEKRVAHAKHSALLMENMVRERVLEEVENVTRKEADLVRAEYRATTNQWRETFAAFIQDQLRATQQMQSIERDRILRDEANEWFHIETAFADCFEFVRDINAKLAHLIDAEWNSRFQIEEAEGIDRKKRIRGWNRSHLQSVVNEVYRLGYVPEEFHMQLTPTSLTNPFGSGFMTPQSQHTAAPSPTSSPAAKQPHLLGNEDSMFRLQRAKNADKQRADTPPTLSRLWKRRHTPPAVAAAGGESEEEAEPLSELERALQDFHPVRQMIPSAVDFRQILDDDRQRREQMEESLVAYKSELYTKKYWPKKKGSTATLGTLPSMPEIPGINTTAAV